MEFEQFQLAIYNVIFATYQQMCQNDFVESHGKSSFTKNGNDKQNRKW